MPSCIKLFSLVTWIFGLLTNISLAQVGTFSAALTQQETMLISWSMREGSTCIDLELQYASEDLNFSPIYIHNGICGSTTKEELYNYEQKFNLKAVNFYRIKLGYTSFSDTIRIDAPLLGSYGILVFPQPSNELVNIQFNNSKSDIFNLELYNSVGNLVEAIHDFKGNIITLNTQTLDKGIYFFKLESRYILHQGRILIIH